MATIAFVVYRLSQTYSDTETFPFDSAGPYYVKRVVDGDTFVLEGGVRVRLLGVNTPETKHPRRPVEPLGPEATEFTTRHIEGRNITLRFDRERRDRYHRVLAYVYVGEWFLNEELILAGYSRAETKYPFSNAMKRRFKAAEELARRNKRGLWAVADQVAR
ncbi:MAG: thermonuclease family protein [Candidatus Hydrogenedentes bacterium]|nr:thermonuclease family protein [Candidatus Hydrogenedentota bacterium]